MFECGTCGKEFRAGFQARENHCFSIGHDPPEFECDTCDEYFDDNWDRSEHMRYLGHATYSKHECSICIERFESAEETEEHEVEDHHYCHDCDRTFNNRNNIKQHLNSRTHRGTEMTCPFCRQQFATATGVTHHVERGSCPKAKNITRDALYKVVRSKDPNGRFSKNLIGGTGSTSYEATDNAWNGRAFECYFCHRQFKQLHGLNQHLASHVHQQNLYHCPGRGCSREFTALASIINHWESETCGFMRFEKVQQNFGNIITPGRRLQF
ncbi:hypothetical protein CONLIGDRAFT_699522 [Coniochaeta ligniaria NRRL 30616]|uniref:C2H2-type domain-containing protein n=1 Tax=Coniochaeta ligniaria NRRL 30616 TaxID=1408157 RepID=A0A1J7JXV2_9PEZI|nr:hypothetical protein CONLIGDRAFT_699522 [Coniochaeta ligniaria NRRL 30616]